MIKQKRFGLDKIVGTMEFLEEIYKVKASQLIQKQQQPKINNEN